MKILVVSQYLPYPPDVGVKIRLFNLIKHLSTKHSISLVCYTSRGDQESNLRRMREYCEFIRLVDHGKKSKARQLPGVAKNLISGIPWDVKYAKSEEMGHAIDEVTKSTSFDVIHFDDVFMASNIDFSCTNGIKKAVTFHNIESINYRRTLRIVRDPYGKLVFLLKWLPMRSWENRIVKNFDLNIVVSPIERRFLESLTAKGKIAFVPNGVDTDSLGLLPVPEREDNILFVGNMDYTPNSDGAVYFAKRIFPLIRKRMPKAKFWVVGQNPKKELKRLSSEPNVILSGSVESVIPYYEKSSVVVVPLRAGGGTRGKILEAMALGRPVVSTSLGAEGLEVTHKENIMIADRPEEFASITVEIMKNMPLIKALRENGRRFVELHHSWEKVAVELDQAYEALSSG